MPWSKKILTGNTELHRLAQAPSEPRIHPRIARDVSVVQAPDVGKSTIPIQVVPRSEKRADLKLMFGCVPWDLFYLRVLAREIALHDHMNDR